MAIDVQLDGVWASEAPEWVTLIDQRYDFSSGELLTRWTFRVDGATATVEAVAFCSRTVPGLAVGRDHGPGRSRCRCRAVSRGRPDRRAGLWRPSPSRRQGPNEGVDGRLRWHSGGDIATLGIAYTTAFAGDAAERTPPR